MELELNQERKGWNNFRCRKSVSSGCSCRGNLVICQKCGYDKGHGSWTLSADFIRQISRVDWSWTILPSRIRFAEHSSRVYEKLHYSTAKSNTTILLFGWPWAAIDAIHAATPLRSSKHFHARREMTRQENHVTAVPHRILGFRTKIAEGHLVAGSQPHYKLFFVASDISVRRALAWVENTVNALPHIAFRSQSGNGYISFAGKPRLE